MEFSAFTGANEMSLIKQRESTEEYMVQFAKEFLKKPQIPNDKFSKLIQVDYIIKYDN